MVREAAKQVVENLWFTAIARIMAAVGVPLGLAVLGYFGTTVLSNSSEIIRLQGQIIHGITPRIAMLEAAQERDNTQLSGLRSELVERERVLEGRIQRQIDYLLERRRER